jgi:hypothetical protein
MAQPSQGKASAGTNQSALILQQFPQPPAFHNSSYKWNFVQLWPCDVKTGVSHPHIPFLHSTRSNTFRRFGPFGGAQIDTVIGAVAVG